MQEHVDLKSQKKPDANSNLESSYQSLHDYSRYSKETIEKIKSKITKLSSALKEVEKEKSIPLDESIRHDIENFKRMQFSKSVKND